MTEFLTFTIIGIVTGAAYAVAASGLVVTYSTSGIFNIAHGAVGMLMAFVFWQLTEAWHGPMAPALLLVVLVLAPLFGAFLERTVIRGVRDNSLAVHLVVTVGLMVLLIGAVEGIWPSEARAAPTFFRGHGFKVVGVNVTWHQAITIMVAVGIALGLRLLLFRTRLGTAMRAVVDNRGLASLNGARPDRVATVSWALGSSLAALAGILIAPQLQLNVLNLTLLVVNAYAAAMVGRLRNLPLTFAGALGIGLLQSYAVGYLPTTGGFWGSTPVQGLRLSIPVLVLFVVLLVLRQDTIERGRLALARTAPAVPGLGRSVLHGALLVAAVAVGSGLLSSGNLVRMGIGLATGLIMLSLVPLTGWGGRVSLCQMTFAGLGAFAMSKAGHGGSVLGLLAAVALAGAVGAVVSLFVVRLRGLYLALATMAFAVAMDNMFFPAPVAFTFDGSVAIPRSSLLGLHLTTTRSYVIFLAVVFALVSIGLYAVRRGPAGRLLAATRDSEAACATLGLSLTTTKLCVFAASAGLAGLAGALFGGMRTVAGATDFEMLQSLPLLLLVVLGGVATCGGALLGGLTSGGLSVLVSYFPQLSFVQLLGPGLAPLTLARFPDGVVPGVAARLRALAAPLGPRPEPTGVRSEADQPAVTIVGRSTPTPAAPAAASRALASEP